MARKASSAPPKFAPAFGLPVIKALPVAEAADLAVAADYEKVADMLMFDAKPPKGATRPGGHGAAFDWQILTGRSFRKPWFLAGGLDPGKCRARHRTVSGARWWMSPPAWKARPA